MTPETAPVPMSDLERAPSAARDRRRARPGLREGIHRLSLYLHTAAHLKPVQWFYLPLRRLQGPVAAGRVSRPGWGRDGRALARVVESWWTERSRAGALARAEEVLAGRFRFLNRDHDFDEIDWNRQYVSRLWTYNLHYFDFALDLARAERATGEEEYRRCFEALATRWIDQTTGRGGTGWEPYVLSLRIVNWAFAMLVFADRLRGGVRDQLLESLEAQVRALETRLEHHIQGNHLIKNYLALAVAGLTFSGREADRWRERGLRGLWREAERQILRDGTHFERSPMYHAIVLADYLRVLDCCAATGTPVPAAVTDRVRAMARAAGILMRPDGGPHRFQDSADGIAPPMAALSHLARRALGVEISSPDAVFALPEAGYFGWADVAGSEKLIIDAGAPGPNHQPGHAHCSLLSFEWQCDGRLVVVDSGVSGYEGDPWREYVRSTRAHNTVSVEEREQSEVWGTFRMARRARLEEAVARMEGGRFIFDGAYRPYGTRVVHRRRLVRDEERGDWSVTDRIEGASGKGIKSHLHLHPDFRIEARGESFLAAAGALKVLITPFGFDRAASVSGLRDPVQGWFCPEFGVAVPAPVLEFACDAYRGGEIGYRMQRIRGD